MEKTFFDFLLQFEGIKSFVSGLSSILGESAGPQLASIFILLMGSIVVLIVSATIGGLGTFAERKISADMQARIGPNRVGPYGIFQLIADALKMVMKEDILPRDADKKLFYLAPAFCLFGVFSTLAVLPISSGFILTDINVGVFYLVAISSLVGVGVFLGGYASNSKWSMLGGMRGAAQIISYEIPVTLSILSISVLAGSLSFGEIVTSQGGNPLKWFIFHNPFAFISFFVFFIGMLAETNRAPFDLPEAESELVSGYNTEYSGVRFAFFAFAEYVEVFVVSGLAATLFLGGYNLPFSANENSFGIQFLQVFLYLVKALSLYYVVIWVRWTFPRLRIDQLMAVCWKYLTPIAIFCLIGNCCWLILFKEKRFFKYLA